ncbi:hypothetical protein DM860_014733 [Cuscuta australis]|uniref:Lumazine-binding domain-containing protein n=1 Tax=Cuscuta australis TaxID=267555 RepID=A0A328DMR9_9ASTE|nr:hypothetical protein DM860_014733 [Cuscuta australis]
MDLIIHRCKTYPDSFTLKIGAKTKTILEGVCLGDNIAVNGTCLIVKNSTLDRPDSWPAWLRRPCGRPPLESWNADLKSIWRGL